MYKTIISLLFLIFSFHISFAKNASSPDQLAEKAQKIFPKISKEITNQLKKEIDSYYEKHNIHKNPKSFITLYIADEFYKSLKTGKFVGAPRLIWNGFDPINSQPSFIYEVSDFAYITSKGRRIKPRKMKTDGGSIPKILHSVGNFTPWTYGPAFIVHDWIFEAHKCALKPDNDIDFETSAMIMAEAIKTLMEVGFKKQDNTVQKFLKKEDTLYLMYLAVKSGVAKSLWDNKETKNCL